MNDLETTIEKKNFYNFKNEDNGLEKLKLDFESMKIQQQELKSKADLKEFVEEKFSENLKSFEQRIEEKFKAEADKNKWIWKGLAIIGVSSLFGAWTIYTKLYDAVYEAANKNLTERITTEFGSQKVTDEINRYAKLYTETTAKSLIASQVGNELTTFKNGIQKDFLAYKSTIDKELAPALSKIKTLIFNIENVQNKTIVLEKKPHCC